MRHSPSTRDRALTRLRRWRQAVVVVVVAGCLGFTALAARGFAGQQRSARPTATSAAPARAPARAPTRAPASAPAPQPVRHHHHHRRHHHHASASGAATATPAPAPAPVPSDQPPVVSSGGS